MPSGILRALNYYSRFFFTGVSFAGFGLGAVFISTVIFPIICLFSWNPVTRSLRMRKVVSFTFRFFFFWVNMVGVCKLHEKGIESLKNDKGLIVIANHPSLIDVVALITLYPHASCIVKESLWHHTYLKGPVRAAKYIPNQHPDKILSMCQEAIERGEVIIIFPEGTRTKPNKSETFLRGASQIAARLNCPIRTIRITVKPTTLTKNEPWYSIPSGKVHITLEPIGLIETKELYGSDTRFSIASRKISEEIERHYFSQGHHI